MVVEDHNDGERASAAPVTLAAAATNRALLSSTKMRENAGGVEKK